MRNTARDRERYLANIDRDPWPLFWEGQPEADGCTDGSGLHTWEHHVIPDRGRGAETVVRCVRCHTPRCGHSDEQDPCQERRHHRTVHIRPSGLFDPVGGHLRDETP